MFAATAVAVLPFTCASQSATNMANIGNVHFQFGAWQPALCSGSFVAAVQIS
jgi:hypothetical protein